MKKIIYVLIFLGFVSLANAQWQPEVRLTNNPAYSATSSCNQWGITSNGNSVHVLFSDNRDGNFEIYYKRSTDAGITWSADTRLTNATDSSFLPSVASTGSTVHLVWQDKRDGNNEIYYKRSVNSGLNWETDFRISNSSSNSSFPSIAVSGSYVNVVWQEGGGIYFKSSTNNGVNWGTDVIIRSSSNSAHTPSICNSGSNIYIAWMELISQNNYVVYCKKSTDYGLNWGPNTTINNINASSQWNPPSIAVSGSHVYVVYNIYNLSNWGIYFKKSTDGGTSWEPEYPLVSSSAVFPNVAVSGSAVHFTYMGGLPTPAIYYRRSTNVGNTWESAIGLTNSSFQSVTPSTSVSGSIVHAIWSDNRDGNWEIYYKQNPTGNPIGIKNISSEVPSSYSLSQNYPNPFNPSTNVQFSISNVQFVTLKVYDMLGKEVATLVNEKLQLGTYEATFDASAYPSGVYFYRLTAGDYSETKKMTLVK